MGSDPQYASYPNLLLSQHIFTLKTPSLSPSHAAAQNTLTASIKEHSQAPLYRYLAHPTEGILSGKIHWDEKFYEELKKSNDDELEGYEKELKEVEEKAGESEVVEAMGKKAEFWARVVNKVDSYHLFGFWQHRIPFIPLQLPFRMVLERPENVKAS